MLVYEKICNLDRDIFDCCQENPGTATPGGDCCYDAWVKDLVQVTADWKQANADAQNREKEYSMTVEELERLKGWWADWEATDEKADALCRQLELFTLHLSKVCMVTEKTDNAVEILFCMIEDLYIRVDKLKTSYDKLLQCIQCLKRPELAAGLGIMQCIGNYGTKLDAVILTRDVLMTQMVTVVELAYGMQLSLCDDYGLKAIILYWKKKLNCGSSSPEQPGHPSYPQQQSVIEPSGNTRECCCLEPRMSFPIDEDEYFIHLESDYKKLKNDVIQLKKDLDAAKEKRDALLSCKQSLEKAIEEVKPAMNCK